MYLKDDILHIWSFKREKDNFNSNIHRVYILKKMLTIFMDRKLEFLRAPSYFLFSLENVLKNLLKVFDKEIILDDVFLLFASAKKILNKTTVSELLDYIISCILQMLSTCGNYVALCKTSKKNSKELDLYAIKMCEKYDKKPYIVFLRSDESLISGFQIYFSDRRIEYTYQRIILTFKEKFQEFVLDRNKR
jgi:hypothetical protein